MKSDRKTDSQAQRLYATIIGTLLYTAICTRIDIAFAIQNHSQFTQNPNQEHWIRVKQIVRYLSRTSNHCLTYGGEDGWPTQLLISYTDSNFASNPNDRKSVTSNVHMLGGAAISWILKKQTVTATLTCEAKYVAASICT